MIVNKTVYHRDLELAQQKRETCYDIVHFKNRYIQKLKTEDKPIYKHLALLDKDIENTFKRAQITRLVETDELETNTIATLSFPEDTALRGDLELRYNRVSLREYFDIDEVILSKRRDKEMVIDYARWVRAVKGEPGVLARLIHRTLGYKLGKTFSHDGITVYQNHDVKGKDIRSRRGLALLVPSLEQIEEGWKFYKNIDEEGKDGSQDYQSLAIYIKLVSSGHMYIEDGEALIKIQLRYPLQNMGRIKRGKFYDE